ncbi:hypothetical protein BKA62DRAFT_731325, partial [Auriculariales sp. MPI-PUGE-AT-0066]
RCGDRLGAAQCTQHLGTIQSYLGNFSEADADSKRLRLNRHGECAVNLGDLRLRQNDYDSAEKYLATARELFTRIGDRSGLALYHLNLGNYVTLKADYKTPRKLFDCGGDFHGDRKSEAATLCRE